MGFESGVECLLCKVSESLSLKISPPITCALGTMGILPLKILIPILCALDTHPTLQLSHASNSQNGWTNPTQLKHDARTSLMAMAWPT